MSAGGAVRAPSRIALRATAGVGGRRPVGARSPHGRGAAGAAVDQRLHQFGRFAARLARQAALGAGATWSIHNWVTAFNKLKKQTNLLRALTPESLGKWGVKLEAEKTSPAQEPVASR